MAPKVEGVSAISVNAASANVAVPTRADGTRDALEDVLIGCVVTRGDQAIAPTNYDTLALRNVVPATGPPVTIWWGWREIPPTAQNTTISWPTSTISSMFVLLVSGLAVPVVLDTTARGAGAGTDASSITISSITVVSGDTLLLMAYAFAGATILNSTTVNPGGTEIAEQNTGPLNASTRTACAVSRSLLQPGTYGRTASATHKADTLAAQSVALRQAEPPSWVGMVGQKG